ncbi:MAG: DUF222 domain-containing protein [bacterium]|nr:DUF222 domain-containing protein [bacterium]
MDALVAALRSAGGDLLEERLGMVGRCESRLAAVKTDTVAELARRNGEAQAAETVRDTLRGSRGAAKRDVRLAGQLTELPDTAKALADGTITPRHAQMIADAADETAVDEAELIDAAAREPTDVFGRTVRGHLDRRTDGEDLQERRRRQRARREASITRQPDGMYKLFGLFDPVAGARVETALAAAARKLRRAEDPDNRSTIPQRFADALEMLVTRTGSGAKQGTTLVVVADYDAVAGRLDNARLADGTPLTADELVRLALEARILPAIFDVEGQPLWLGRECRDASEAQRIALTARDEGCVGCGASHSFCQPHHNRHWEHGGPTDIDNLCLLCSHCHHTLVHRLGADVAKDSHGKFTLRRPFDKPPPCPGPRARGRASSNGAGDKGGPPLRC